MFNEGIVSGQAHTIMYIQFTSHICNHVSCNRHCSNLCCSIKFQQTGGQCWSVNIFYYVASELKIKWCKVRRIRWPRIRAVSANLFSLKFSIQEVLNCSVKMQMFPTPSCCSSWSLGFFFFPKLDHHEEFLKCV